MLHNFDVGFKVVDIVMCSREYEREIVYFKLIGSILLYIIFAFTDQPWERLSYELPYTFDVTKLDSGNYDLFCNRIPIVFH
jgi:hypothetical protein